MFESSLVLNMQLVMDMREMLSEEMGDMANEVVDWKSMKERRSMQLTGDPF